MSFPDNHEPARPRRRGDRRSEEERTVDDEFWGDRGGRTSRRSRRRSAAAQRDDGPAPGPDVRRPARPPGGATPPGPAATGRRRRDGAGDPPGGRPPFRQPAGDPPPSGRGPSGTQGYGAGGRGDATGHVPPIGAGRLRPAPGAGLRRDPAPAAPSRATGEHRLRATGGWTPGAPRAGMPGYGSDPSAPRPARGDRPTGRPYGGVPDDVYASPYGDDAYGGDTYGDDVYGVDTYGDDVYGDADDEPRHRRGCRAVLLVLLVVVLAAVVAGLLGWRWAQQQIDPPGPPGEVVIVEVPSGSSTAQIGDELAANGVITSASVWQWYTRVNSVGAIQAGQYEMQRNSSFTEAIEVLEAGPLPPEADTVTVPEGLTVDQTVARLVDPEEGVEGFTEDAVEAALADPAVRSSHLPDGRDSLEGTLFPETYRIEDGDDEAAIVARMVTQFDTVMEDLDARAGADDLGLSTYEVLTVASLIEKETRVDDERGKVARVIHNRLERGEPLGIDATSCYEKGEIPCTLTTVDLEADSPYSTRQRPGLPPTPIASPGRASLEAALDPEDGEWMFYVFDAEGDGDRHVFTDDYDEFLRAKQRCEDAGMCG